MCITQPLDIKTLSHLIYIAIGGGKNTMNSITKFFCNYEHFSTSNKCCFIRIDDNLLSAVGAFAKENEKKIID